MARARGVGDSLPLGRARKRGVSGWSSEEQDEEQDYDGDGDSYCYRDVVAKTVSRPEAWPESRAATAHIPSSLVAPVKRGPQYSIWGQAAAWAQGAGAFFVGHA